jgi:hypothetical protein
MSLVEFHARLGNAGMLFALGLGLWGLILYFRQQGVTSSYFGSLVVGELLYLGQAIVGGLLYSGGRSPGQSVHILYGVLTVISIPAAYSYTRGNTDRRVALIYGVVGLFLFGVSLRAITTAG